MLTLPRLYNFAIGVAPDLNFFQKCMVWLPDYNMIVTLVSMVTYIFSVGIHGNWSSLSKHEYCHSTYLLRLQLMRFIDNMKKKMVDSGDIYGLYLTGLTEEAVKLLSNYVDKVSGNSV